MYFYGACYRLSKSLEVIQTNCHYAFCVNVNLCLDIEL